MNKFILHVSITIISAWRVKFESTAVLKNIIYMVKNHINIKNTICNLRARTLYDP